MFVPLPNGEQDAAGLSLFFPAATNMLLKSVNVDIFADAGELMAFVQTEMTGFLLQKPATHFTGVLQSCPNQTAVMHVGSCHNHPQGNSPTIHMQMNFAAATPSVGWITAKPFSRRFFESVSELAAKSRP